MQNLHGHTDYKNVLCSVYFWSAGSEMDVYNQFADFLFNDLSFFDFIPQFFLLEARITYFHL